MSTLRIAGARVFEADGSFVHRDLCLEGWRIADDIVAADETFDATGLTASTLTPARAIGVDADYGSLEAGKVANVVLVDDDLHIHAIFLRGERLA